MRRFIKKKKKNVRARYGIRVCVCYANWVHKKKKKNQALAHAVFFLLFFRPYKETPRENDFIIPDLQKKKKRNLFYYYYSFTYKKRKNLRLRRSRRASISTTIIGISEGLQTRLLYNTAAPRRP